MMDSLLWPARLMTVSICHTSKLKLNKYDILARPTPTLPRRIPQAFGHYETASLARLVRARDGGMRLVWRGWGRVGEMHKNLVETSRVLCSKNCPCRSEHIAVRPPPPREPKARKLSSRAQALANAGRGKQLQQYDRDFTSPLSPMERICERTFHYL